MTSPVAAGGKTVSEVLLAQVLEKMGEVLESMGSMKSRLDHGQNQFLTIRNEHAELRRMLEPVVSKVTAWEEHVEEAKETTKKFTEMEPDFKKMKTVTERFLSVAMVQGSIVGAALWGITWIAPVIWEFVKSHVSVKLGG